MPDPAYINGHIYTRITAGVFLAAISFSYLIPEENPRCAEIYQGKLPPNADAQIRNQRTLIATIERLNNTYNPQPCECSNPEDTTLRPRLTLRPIVWVLFRLYSGVTEYLKSK